MSFQCLAYFLGAPPPQVSFTLRPDRHGSLEGADKDAVTAYTFVWEGHTARGKKCLLGVFMSMTHCINPRTTLNTAATSAAQGMTGRLASDQPPGPRSATFSLKKKTDNGHSHQRINSARDSGLNFALQRNSNTTSNTTAPHIRTPSPVVSKPA